MTTKNRITKLEGMPVMPQARVNPYASMSDAELLQTMKDIVESGPAETPEQAAFDKMAKALLLNNGITWSVKYDN